MIEKNDFKILLIEDEESDVILVQKALEHANSFEFEIKHADCLKQGIECLKSERVDVVLLDLSLPDSQGIDTLSHFCTKVNDVPIIVFTGNTDEEASIQAFQKGIQDYVMKGSMDGNTLVRSIRYAIERQSLLSKLELLKKQEAFQTEIDSLGKFSTLDSRRSQPSVNDLGALAERHSVKFNEYVKQYGLLLDQTLDVRIFKVDINISQELYRLSDRLGELSCGPRDVIAIHTQALNDAIEHCEIEKKSYYMEEARLLVLELMGYLLSYYRSQTAGESMKFEKLSEVNE